MNVRLKKEFTALFWPWLVAAVVGLLPLLSWMLPDSQFEQNFRSVYILAGAGFVIGIALLSTMPFGEEFSLRTMPMLLSHPVTRWQIWADKLKITLGLTITVALLNIISCLPFWGFMGGQLKLASAFLIFTVSSGAFWVLFARSTIGGMVLCLFTQAVIVVTAYALTQARYFDIGVWDSSQDTEGILLGASLIVSPLLMLLGWKLFSRLQDSGAATLEIPFLANLDSTQASRFTYFRARSDSPRLNLLLKELSFYKPVFVMAYLFAGLWIGVLLLLTCFPLKYNLLSNTMNGFLAIYAAMALVISGCISLGEEKGLGLHGSNLTLPVSWTRQWFLKISIALTVGLVCAVILPLLLAKFETFFAIRPMDTMAKGFLKEQSGLIAYCVMLSSFVAVSFWSATLTNRTIHAAFLAGFTILFIAVFHAMGKSMSLGLLTAPLLDWITAHRHLHLGWAADYNEKLVYLSYAFIGLLFLVLSRFCYQNLKAPKITIIKTGLGMVVISWICGAVVTDIHRSASNQYSEFHPFVTESRAALLASKADSWPARYPKDRPLWYGGTYLTKSGKLSPLTAKWLERSVFRVEHNTYTNSYDQKTYISIHAYLQKDSSGGYIFRRPLMHTNFSTEISPGAK